MDILWNHEEMASVNSYMTVFGQRLLPECIQRITQAERLCAVYPHLNNQIVTVSLLLLEYVRSGYLNGGLQGVLNVLSDFEDGQRLKVLQVMIEAQTDYATGEAKIVQYFCH